MNIIQNIFYKIENYENIKIFFLNEFNKEYYEPELFTEESYWKNEKIVNGLKREKNEISITKKSYLNL